MNPHSQDVSSAERARVQVACNRISMPVETAFYASCVMTVIIKLPFDNNVKPSELQTQKEKKHSECCLTTGLYYVRTL